LPRYLRFVRGVIDPSDLPLNVSREFLQTSDLVSSIKKTSIKKILTLLEKMAENEKEKYDARFEDLASILYDQAVLSEGKTLHNSADYVKRVNSLLIN